MNSRYSVYSKRDTVKSLLTICVEHLLSHIDLYSNYFPVLPVQIKNRILKRLTSVQTKYPNTTELYGMLVHSQLKRFDFSLSCLDDEMLNILSGCRDLRELILTRNKNSILTDKALLDILPNFKKLIILQAQNCFAITDEVIKVLIENCPNLSELDLAGCRNISDVSLVEISKLNKLKALNISRTKITNNGIRDLVEGPSGPFLKELRLADCESVTHIAINLICENCKSLEAFIFNNCTSASDQSKVNFDNDNFTKLKQLTWTVYW